VSGSDTGTSVRARATLRTTLRLRLELRFPRLLVDFLFLAAKVVADYAGCDEFGQAKFTFWCRWQRRLQTKRSRAAHVGAGTRIDLDRLAFFDEKRNVDGHAGLKRRRLGNVARRIAAQSFRGFGYLQAHRRG
jgi:hypothetical protein